MRRQGSEARKNADAEPCDDEDLCGSVITEFEDHVRRVTGIVEEGVDLAAEPGCALG
jgi:hypothetical protein